MKTPAWLHDKECKMLLFLLIIFGGISMHAQPSLYGPAYPPPKESSITFSGTLNDGGIGLTGGKTITITNITLSNTTDVFFSMLSDGIRLSMDDANYTGNEILQYDPAQSDLQQGKLIWTGATYIPVSNGPSYSNRALQSRFVMTVSAGGSPVWLQEPIKHGLSTGCGGLALFTGFDMVMNIVMEMFVSDNGGATWVPHLVYYNNAATPPNAESAHSSVEFGFYWKNDPPELYLNRGATVDEGDTVLINKADWQARDVESSFEEILLITDPLKEALLPAHGILYLNDTPVLPGDTITMYNILYDKVKYIHDGSETEKDSIPFSIVDSDNAKCRIGLDSVFYFLLNITPVDDPPVLEKNNGATIDEDAILVLTGDHLLTADPESGPEGITYTIDPEGNSEFPKHGLLKRNAVPLGDGGTFSQADIDAGKLTYDHDGSETTTDGFVFRVADEYGHSADNNGSNTFFFEITVNTHNDDPILTKLLPLEISEGGTGVIGNMLIAASDEESPPAEIKFTLDPNSELEEPNYGEVKLNGVVLSDGEGFTMADVNNNLVTYTHDGSQNFNDFFLFNVSDPQGGVAHDGEYTLFHFNVVINNQNDAPILANPVQDMQIRAEEAFSFVVPEHTFEDVDPDDILSYTSMLVGDTNLPGWLGFDQGTVKFSGTPQVSDIETLEIILIASDMSFAEARDTFQLMVIQPVYSGPEETEQILQVGPNPFRETVFISIDATMPYPTEIAICNILGEKTVIPCRNEPAVIELDLKDHPPGIYYLQVKIGDDIIVSKLLKAE
jgi:hypothetical protein